jgi:hypothetical protein
VLVIAADPPPPYFTHALREERVRELKDGRCAVVAGGHHLHMEQPRLVGDLVRSGLVD